MSSWIPWGRKKEPPPSKLEQGWKYYDVAVEQIYATPPPALILSGFVLGLGVAGGRYRIHRRLLKRIRNSNWITPDYYEKQRILRGRVTSVGDADNFRFYHEPLFSRRVPESAKDLKGETIHIRLAGIDAPEGGHFGKTAQPYYSESLNWLKGQVLGERVYCQLLRRDQYGRSVAMVFRKPRFMPAFLLRYLPAWLTRERCLSKEMLQAGWAYTYKESGAEYGKYSKEEFLQLEQEAEKARRGLFAKGRPKESPADYKRKMAKDAAAAESQSEIAIEPQPKDNFLKRMYRRLAKR